MKIGILFDGGSQDWDQKDVAAVMANVTEIQGWLRRAGHETSLIPVHLGDVAWLRRVQRHDLIFNLCEGVNGYARYEDFAVAALELTRVPFTGCPSWPVTICHRKHIANTLLAAAGVPVPPFMLARGITPPAGLRYPVIVKPSGEDILISWHGHNDRGLGVSKMRPFWRITRRVSSFRTIATRFFGGGKSRCRPRRLASHSAARGHAPHSGSLGKHTVAPNSMTAWFQRPGSHTSNN